MRRGLCASLAVAAALALAGCTASTPTALTIDQARAAELSADQLDDLGGVPAVADIPDYTAAELVAVAGSPKVVDPEGCREYVQSIAVPGQVIVPSQDADSVDPVAVAPHLDVGQGYVEQALRVLPDAAAATQLVADLRALASDCATFEYGSAGNVNRFSTVTTGDLPFEGDGYLSTIEVKGTKFVVETDEIYVVQVGNVVATVRGTAGQTQPFAEALVANLRAQG